MKPLPPLLGAKAIISPGVPVIVECNAISGLYGVVFEDDGTTGYFYARDYSQKDLFVDALHIYNSLGVTDRHLLSELSIVWSRDGHKSLLLINERAHALFDFPEKLGYSRSEFPDAFAGSGWKRCKWDPALKKYFGRDELSE